ncbi:protein N-terminal glutamine amidohydrolase-like [Amphiura filiformis]|uniref:protein N-terminal glutamine amidohydrolase-like n=1 Tax=Amphiura filiformis TaxID=82378 RepID=UPI003B21F1DB
MAATHQNRESLPLISDANQCVYTSCYCEENIWKLCEHISTTRPEELCHCYAAFISNDQRMVPLWMQKARRAPDQPVIWDYHVLFIHKPTEGSPQVYDLDTVLPLPTSFSTYMSEAIQEEYSIRPEFHRKFRVIPAEVFLAHFASDRSHMRNEDGTWMQPPPLYQCIATQDSTMNLDDYISMDPAIGVGQVMDLQGILKHFGTS